MKPHPSLPRPITTAIRQAKFRLAIARACDTALICGTTAAVIAAPILYFAQLSPLIPMLPWLTAAIFSIGGFVWFGRRPTTNDAVASLDRINETHELVASAVTSQHSRDAWAVTVINLASAACATAKLPPLLGKYAGRVHAATWSGIAGLLLLVSLGRAPLLAKNGPQELNDAIKTENTISTESPESQIAQRDPEGDMNRQVAPEQSAHPGNDTTRKGEINSTGRGRSDAASASRDLSKDRRERSSSPKAAATIPGSGTGEAAESNQKSNDTGGDVTTMERPVAPWELDSWPSRDEAKTNKDNPASAVPDVYRDVVREYFNR